MTRTSTAIVAVFLGALACSRSDQSDATPQQRAPAQTTGQAAEAVVPAAPGASGATAGRPAPSITLAATDIADVRRGMVEDAIAITGDLRPIERVDVRARIEGDLDGLFAQEGQHVAVGQVLAQFESSEQQGALATAVADSASAAADLATARWNLDQSSELFKAGAIAEQDLKASQNAVSAAVARLAAANSRLRSAARALRDTRVVAPTTGVIETKVAENGEHLAKGATIFSLVRSDVLELAAAVPSRQANNVRVGQVVHFVADARRFDGKVARVSPTVDPSTRSITVYAQVPNADGSLKGGTFASGRVVSRTVSNALVVPTTALRQSPDDNRPYVYRIANRVLDRAPVDVGVVDERAGLAEVTNGLSEGDRVVVGNVGALGRGMQVIVAGEERGRPQRDDAAGGRQ